MMTMSPGAGYANLEGRRHRHRPATLASRNGSYNALA